MPRRNRHILYVTEGLNRGGTEGHLAKITPAMRRLGWDVSIFCLSDVGPLAPEVERQGVRVIGPPISQLSKRSPLFGPRIGLAAVKLLVTLLRDRPQVIHCFLPGPYIVGAPLALFTRVPVRLMSRRSLNRYQEKWRLVRAIEPALHRRMNAVVANSRSLVPELREEGCDLERIGLIYNGVSVESFDSAKPTDLSRFIGKKKPALVLITVANLIGYKGHQDVLDALALVADRLPQPWALLCVGQDLGIGELLKSRTRQLGIDRNVHFLGERSDVPSLLKASDIALLCSHQEGFSNAILEAMAAGLPVIATNVGGNPEAVVDGVTGFTVPPSSPVTLSEVLLKLANDKAAIGKMGEAGRERVEALFSHEACCALYDRLYRVLSEGRPISDIREITV